MKVVAIIQARMGSTRLPGKILKKVMSKTLLEYQLDRVKRAELIDDIVVATTVEQADNPIAELCADLQINVFRGSEHDVLSRYYEAAVEHEADVIVRLTSDCPLIDPIIVDQVIKLYLDYLIEIDYASNTLDRTYPRGLDTEVFSFAALKQMHEQATLFRDREHVTSYLYTNPNIFSLKQLKNKVDLSAYRWTVDTLEDFQLVELILQDIYLIKNDFGMLDIVALMAKNPEWAKINAQIEQKKI